MNLNFNAFLNKINDLFNECFPLKTKSISEKRLHNPWITSAVIKSIKTKNNLFKDYKIGIVTESYYKQYRNVLNKIIKNYKNSYYMSIFTNFKNDTRKIWKTKHQLNNLNDLPDLFSNLKTILFADDSTLFITGANPTTLMERANHDLKSFHKWCFSNRLTVN